MTGSGLIYAMENIYASSLSKPRRVIVKEGKTMEDYW